MVRKMIALKCHRSILSTYIIVRILVITLRGGYILNVLVLNSTLIHYYGNIFFFFTSEIYNRLRRTARLGHLFT